MEVQAWEVFPAAAEAEVKNARRVQAESAVSAEEASCFSHPAKRAVDAAK